MAAKSNGSKHLSDIFFYYLKPERFFLKWNSLPASRDSHKEKGERVQHVPLFLDTYLPSYRYCTLPFWRINGCNSPVLLYKEVDSWEKMVFVFPGHLTFVPCVSRSCQLAAVTLRCAGMRRKGEVEVTRPHSSAAARKQPSW